MKLLYVHFGLDSQCMSHITEMLTYADRPIYSKFPFCWSSKCDFSWKMELLYVHFGLDSQCTVQLYISDPLKYTSSHTNYGVQPANRSFPFLEKIACSIACSHQQSVLRVLGLDILLFRWRRQTSSWLRSFRKRYRKLNSCITSSQHVNEPTPIPV